MAGDTTLSVRLGDVSRNERGDLRLGSLVRKSDLQDLLARAEQSDAYRNARDKYEFRIRDTGTDVFLELKRRSTGVFGKLTGFVRAPMRQAERNAAIVSLSKFNDAWQSEANRKLFSKESYRATTKTAAREFHTDLVGRLQQDQAAAAAAKRENARAWVAIKDGAIDGMIAEAAGRAGVGAEQAALAKADIVARLGIAVGDLDRRVLEPAELRQVLEGQLDRVMQRQRVKLDEIAKLGITDPVEADLVTQALLSSGKSMPAAYFDQARQAGETLVAGLKRLGGIASEDERRAAAAEIVTAYQRNVAAAGNSGSQEINDFGALVAGIATSEAGADLAGMKDTVAEFMNFAGDFRMGDDDALSGAGSSALYPLLGIMESIERAAGPQEGAAL